MDNAADESQQPETPDQKHAREREEHRAAMDRIDEQLRKKGSAKT